MRRVLVLGPPGSGKIVHARGLHAEVNPRPLEGDLALLASWLHHGALLRPIVDPACVAAPRRAPHHTVSEAGLVAQALGSRVRPSEANLAHGGTLLLDDLPEFSRGCIASLAAALRDGFTRQNVRSAPGGPIETIYLPARPALLVATASLCACGLLGTAGLRPCSCSPRALESRAERLESFRRALRIEEVVALQPKTVAELLEVNRV